MRMSTALHNQESGGRVLRLLEGVTSFPQLKEGSPSELGGGRAEKVARSSAVSSEGMECNVQKKTWHTRGRLWDRN